MGTEWDPPVSDTAMVPLGSQQIEQRRSSALPSPWPNISVPADWLDRVEAMLLHSAMLTGASSNHEEIINLAAAMAPVLMHSMTLEELEQAYMRWCTTTMQEPGRAKLKVQAAELLACFSEMRSEQAAEKARQAEEKARQYRDEAQAALRRNPRPMQHISDLAQRDGVVLPWDPGKPTAPRQGDAFTPEERAAREALMAAQEQERIAREQRNREAWHQLAAEHERKQAERVAGKPKRKRGRK